MFDKDQLERVLLQHAVDEDVIACILSLNEDTTSIDEMIEVGLDSHTLRLLIPRSL